MQRRNLERQLRRVILGEMKSAEIQQVAEREGFCSFSDLCESSLPETLRSIRLTETTLVDRLRACLSGRLDLDQGRGQRPHHAHSSHADQTEEHERDPEPVRPGE